jgi:hypothetical protein
MLVTSTNTNPIFTIKLLTRTKKTRDTMIPITLRIVNDVTEDMVENPSTRGGGYISYFVSADA